MKRDWKLIREILLAVEEKEDIFSCLQGKCDSVRSVAEKTAWLLAEAGILQGEHLSYRLTWNGHDLLEHLRDEKRLTTAIDGLQECGEPATESNLKERIYGLWEMHMNVKVQRLMEMPTSEFLSQCKSSQ